MDTKKMRRVGEAIVYQKTMPTAATVCGRMLIEAADEIEKLTNFKVAYDEWIHKTQWVQDSDIGGNGRLGKHRADVMREEIERLQSLVKEDYNGKGIRYCERSQQ